MMDQIKELERQVERLEYENKLKTGWISLISHDSKEIFGSFLWLINAVDEKIITKEDFFSMLPQVKRDAKKNLQTVLDTTEWLKTQYGKFQPHYEDLNVFEIYKELNNEHQEKTHKKHLDFQFEGNKHLSIQTDRLLIFFILNKLLHNAIKYSKVGQKIILKFSMEDNNAILSIVDSGIGIGEKHLKDMMSFDTPVFQGTDGEIGAGLSLKIVENFVFLMNGRMEIISSENEGTKISFYLPQIKK